MLQTKHLRLDLIENLEISLFTPAVRLGSIWPSRAAPLLTRAGYFIPWLR